MSRVGMLGRLPLALYSLTNDGLSEAQALVNLLGGDNGPAWIAYLKRVRSDGLPDADLKAWVPSALALIDPDVELDLGACDDPSALTTREGVVISSDFVSRVLSRAVKFVRPEGMSFSSWELTEAARGHEIIAAHGMNGMNGTFDESVLCACIDRMMRLQRSGEEGALLADGRWNIFCLADCVVTMYWTGRLLGWHIRPWDLSGPWGIGSRTFSPN